MRHKLITIRCYCNIVFTVTRDTVCLFRVVVLEVATLNIPETMQEIVIHRSQQAKDMLGHDAPAVSCQWLVLLVCDELWAAWLNS